MTTDRRSAIKRMLLDDAGRSDRRIATATGSSHQQVARVRRELERTGTLRSPQRREGADGRLRAAEVTEADPAYTGGLAAIVKRLHGIA